MQRVFGLLLVFSSVAHADEIKVHQSGGVEGSTTGAPAIVTFETVERIVVNRVTSQSSATVIGPGGTASGFASSSTALCTTPCKLEMPAGFYRLRFGEGNWNKPIDFSLKPGENKYRIKPFRAGRMATGFLLAVAGGTAACVGLSLGIIQGSAPMYALGAIGGGVTIGGAVLISTAKAEAIPIR
jgi:hypothetical protein